MFKKILLNLMLILSLSMGIPSKSFGQTPEASSSASSGPRKQLATIVFAGLAGAVLGLSTLSFYGRPQDKLSNIAVGFAIGIIVGTAYTTYKQATRPYTATEFESQMQFAELDKWEQMNTSNYLNLNTGWTF